MKETEHDHQEPEVPERSAFDVHPSGREILALLGYFACCSMGGWNLPLALIFVVLLLMTIVIVVLNESGDSKKNLREEIRS